LHLWLMLAIVLVADLLAVGAMLLIRRRTPEGFHRDAAHSSAALQVAGTIFAVLIGFVFLVAFQSYGKARSSAQQEANATESLFYAASFFPRPTGEKLQGDLVCYGRSVIDQEWPDMDAGGNPASPVTERWIGELGDDFAALAGDPALEGAAAQDWFTATDAREGARHERLAERSALVPLSVWVLLLLCAIGLLGFTLIFADRRERRLSQAVMVIVITTLVASGLVTIAFLDDAYGDHRGAVGPTAMQRAVREMERQVVEAESPLPAPPCDEDGLQT
jgi:ABC-type multidrug transport system fused ATPase/permease subunit